MRAVLLDTLADSAAAAGVAVTGAIILADPGLSWLDPAIALVIAAVVGYHALRLVREVITTLLHEPPPAPPAPPPAPPWPARRSLRWARLVPQPSTASMVRRPIAAISGLSAELARHASDSASAQPRARAQIPSPSAGPPAEW